VALLGVAVAGRAVKAGTVEVTVRGIASGGAGVGDLPDGRVVFVPRTAPGDRARIEVVKDKPRWALGSLERVLEAGPGRTEPLCPLYAGCGGCQLQHLPYEAQLAWKGRFVADALTRLGHLGEVEPPEVVPSPRTEGYRARMSFTLRRLRGGRVVAGLHALGRPAHVVDVGSECVLPSAPIGEAWVRLRRAWGPGARALPAGGRLRLTLRSTGAGVELLVEGGDTGWDAADLAAELPDVVAIYHRPVGVEGTPELVHGTEGLGGAFEQVNPGAAALLRSHVVEVAGDWETAVDAYCGAGDFAVALARPGARITGIEVDPDACAVARTRVPEGVSIVEGGVEELLPTLLPTGLLLLNPPRTGLAASVPEAIRTAPPRRLVYVSCDPATLARDLHALGGGFRVTGLKAFDLFPHTAHVESVAVLEPEEGRA